MLLRTMLESLTKESLMDKARDMEIKRCSGLKKAALIDRIVEEFCSENQLRGWMECLSNEQMELFRAACKAPQEISIYNTFDAIKMAVYWVGGFENPTDRFCVYDEIKEAFASIDDEAFREKQRKKGWLVKCIRFFTEYYGIAPLETIYKLYSLRVKDTLDNMIDMIWGLPVGIVESCILPPDRLALEKVLKTDPLYTETGILVHIYKFQNGEIEYLIKEQQDKEFFIPSASIIDEINRIGYEESSPSYTKLKVFYQNKLQMNHEQAMSWCLQSWVNSNNGENPTDILRKLSESQVYVNGEKQLREYVNLLMDAHNHTRMINNRGYRPVDILPRDFSKGIPTIVPASTKAAEMLRQSEPQLRTMGFTVDVDGGADTLHTMLYPSGISGDAIRVEKKIYPNDPCPCGSGMKYKRCCGRK